MSLDKKNVLPWLASIAVVISRVYPECALNLSVVVLVPTNCFRTPKGDIYQYVNVSLLFFLFRISSFP